MMARVVSLDLLLLHYNHIYYNNRITKCSKINVSHNSYNLGSLK